MSWVLVTDCAFLLCPSALQQLCKSMSEPQVQQQLLEVLPGLHELGSGH